MGGWEAARLQNNQIPKRVHSSHRVKYLCQTWSNMSQRWCQSSTINTSSGGKDMLTTMGRQTPGNLSRWFNGLHLISQPCLARKPGTRVISREIDVSTSDNWTKYNTETSHPRLLWKGKWLNKQLEQTTSDYGQQIYIPQPNFQDLSHLEIWTKDAKKQKKIQSL